jgi:hypothetical protein
VDGGSVQELLRRPVRLRGIELGRPVDLVLDRERRRGLGLEVVCGDDERRFLPLAVGHVSGDAIEVRSSLVLLDERELAFYMDRGSTYGSLRGAQVFVAGEPVGSLEDVVLAVDGSIESVRVAAPEGARELPFTADVVLGAPRRSVRAAS